MGQSTCDADGGQTWDETIREIEFRDVSFCYPGTNFPVLRNISFSLKQGQVLAIIGKNGTGKTTLIKLISRLYEPTSGKIFVNGKDIKDYSARSLQKYISVVFQDYGHYHVTAQENIGLGQTDLINNITAIEVAARKSGAHSDINALPAKYQTMLGKWFEKGCDLSLGQWQKIALARAYLRNGSVLILDEPTSALDAEAEYETFEELNRSMANQIIILVSHRFSTVRSVEQILVLDKGQIVEAGSHEELINRDGIYSHLYHLQAQSYHSA